MGRVMCFSGLGILILLFVALCGAAPDSETLVLRPVGSEYQQVSTKAGGEFSVKRHFTCVATTITTSSWLLKRLLRQRSRRGCKHEIMFIRCAISHFRNVTAFLKSYVKHAMRNHRARLVSFIDNQNFDITNYGNLCWTVEFCHTSQNLGLNFITV